jgi:ribosomal protein S1
MSAKGPDELHSEIEAALQGVDLQRLDATEAEAEATSRRRDRNLKRGTVVGITGNDVFVELGPRMQGVASITEFEEPPRVGEHYDFTLRGREDELWLLSRREAAELASWDDLTVGAIVKARVTGQNVGGLELRIGPVTAFLPASHVALQHVEDLASFLGQHLVCQVLEIERDRRRVVLSRRAVLEREREQARASAAEGLRPGELVRGRVTRLEKFGAFVQLAPGVEGLVHVSNLARRRVEDPADVLSLGDTVEAVVLEVKEGGRRIGLGMKQLEPDPWDEARERWPEEQVASGRVVRLTDFGAFVELEPGLEGLLHVSQIAKDRVRRARDVLKVGDEVAVRILSVDPAARRISLSRLDAHGAVLGSEEAADTGAVQDALRSSPPTRLGTNLGDLLRRKLGPEGERR